MPPANSGRVRLSEHVSQAIIELIETRHLQPGDLLPPEPELQQQMGVGRSSVREALRGLAVLGVVEIRQGHGTFVRATQQTTRDPNGAEAILGALARGLTEELLEAREVVEVRIASLAAQRAIDDDLADLDRVVTAARSAHAAHKSSYLVGADFHLAVARAAHNDVLEGFVASYVPVLAERGIVLERLPGYVEWEIGQHDAIRQAIVRHDARQAAALMRGHLKDMEIHYDHLATAGLRLPATEAFKRGGRTALHDVARS